ncbi:hypothetical protein PUN28_013878 [Cardiocondyla obscurior]|uniref:Uncharacterized protein n=1 Tax=Cardiocondyla obscurior TaxID=286306 RepID=A0AAW2F5T1_9HYME
MTVKEKLEAYRRKKRKEEMIKSMKSVMANIFSWNRENRIEKLDDKLTGDEQVKLLEQSVDIQEENIQEEDVQDNVEKSQDLGQRNVASSVPIPSSIQIARR